MKFELITFIKNCLLLISPYALYVLISNFIKHIRTCQYSTYLKIGEFTIYETECGNSYVPRIRDKTIISHEYCPFCERRVIFDKLPI